MLAILNSPADNIPVGKIRLRRVRKMSDQETLKARIRQIQQELDRLNAEKIMLEWELKFKEAEGRE